MSKPRQLTDMAVRVHPAGYVDEVDENLRAIEIVAVGLDELPEDEPMGADVLPTAVYLGSVLARVDAAVRHISDEVYRAAGEHGFRSSPERIVGEVYCQASPPWCYPDPRGADLVPQLFITVHRRRVKWWVAQIKFVLATIHALDVGAPCERLDLDAIARAWL